jgi:2-C-methyl-D-erythritol 2,4-cyclodiphosphate synthase
VVNVDATVVAERPKLGPRRTEMAERLSAVIGAPVSVKATTTEGLGALGRAEGIAVLAVALVESG